MWTYPKGHFEMNGELCKVEVERFILHEKLVIDWRMEEGFPEFHLGWKGLQMYIFPFPLLAVYSLSHSESRFCSTYVFYHAKLILSWLYGFS